jgi:small nuclear ribonucleoprotein (snRNP)-like protein
MNTTNTNTNTNPDIPVSLGKPSLRRRLEAYYSLVNPASIEDPVKWRTTFDQIYDKYGGTYQGERTLAAKLSKKYGSARVRLLLAESVATARSTNGNNQPNQSATQQPQQQQQQQQQQRINEAWFELRPEEMGSGVITMTSSQFDPVAALQLPECRVVQDNPWLVSCPVLNCIDHFRPHLPANDPLFQESKRKKPPNLLKHNQAGSMATTNNETQKQQQQQLQQKQKTSPFAAIAESLPKAGPFQVLYRLWEKRQRVRILIRYVNGIRGTLTGYLVAFDKHYNIILKDVEEVYHPRPVSRSSGTNDEEADPDVDKDSNRGAGMSRWKVRKRHMKQLLVRGDNVVLVYKADQPDARRHVGRAVAATASRPKSGSTLGSRESQI